MTRLAFAVSAALLLAVVSSAEDKLTGPAIAEVKIDPKDKLGVKAGKWTDPAQVTTAEELEKLVTDKNTRDKIAKAVDLKTHNLLVFCWQGSGSDKIDCIVLESYPEQLKFSMKMGLTDDLRTHTKVFAVRKNVRWSAK